MSPINTSTTGDNTMAKIDWKNKQLIEDAVISSFTYTDALSKLGLRMIGHNNKTLRKWCEYHNIDYSHFDPSYTTVNKLNKLRLIPLNEILEGKHPTYKTFSLKNRLFKENIKENKCEECGQDNNWNGKELKLHLDHINGDGTDHRLSNLRILCPNCHSQTDTYTGKNRSDAGTGIRKNPIHGNRQQYNDYRKTRYYHKHKHLIPVIENSNIDFSKLGWSKQVAQLVNIRPQQVKKWMEKVMPDFYENFCYKRPSPPRKQ